MSKEILAALEDMKGKLQDDVANIKKEGEAIDTAIAGNLGDVFEMAKANKMSVEEIRAAQNDATVKLTELTDNVTKGFEAQTTNTTALTDLTGRLDDILKQGNLAGVVAGEEAPNAELKNTTVDFYKRMHDYQHGAKKSAPAFNPSAVDDDQIKQYAFYRSGMSKMFRADGGDNETVFMLPEERKAVSTTSHGDQFFLPSEMSDRIVSCYRDKSVLVGQFDNVRMSAHSLIVPVEPQEGLTAEWDCETSCEQDQMDLQQWGNITLTVQDMAAKACITGVMARDSAVDIESRLGNIARRSFETKISDEYFNSNNSGPMEGAFDPGHHVTVETAEAGVISYKDILKVAFSYPSRFRQGARWYMNCNAAGYFATMCDALGRPLFINDNTTNGSFSMGGYPVEVIDQMPDISADGVTLTPGAKGVALVNPFDHYMLGRREDLRAVRNPWRKMNCNLIEWYFRQSLAGAIKCPDAFRALKIKE